MGTGMGADKDPRRGSRGGGERGVHPEPALPVPDAPPKNEPPLPPTVRNQGVGP